MEMNVKIWHTLTCYVSTVASCYWCNENVCWRCFILSVVLFLFYRVVRVHIYGNVGSFTMNACIIYLWLKWYRNYKRKFKLARVTVKYRLPRFLALSVEVESTVCCCRHGSSRWHRPRVCLNALLHRRRHPSWQRKHQSGTNRSQCLRLQWTVSRRTWSRQLIPSFHLRLTPRTCSPSFSYCSSPMVNWWRTRKFVALSPLRYLDQSGNF